jgi:hypothetical protein
MHSLHIPTPPEFQFWPTAFGHGWCDLPPFRSDENEQRLERIERLSDGRVVRLVMRGEPGAVQVDSAEALTPGQEAEVRAVVARCLRLDEDMGEFYALLRQYPRFAWVEQIGAGRMLTSPTVWEDLVTSTSLNNCEYHSIIAMSCQVPKCEEM